MQLQRMLGNRAVSQMATRDKLSPHAGTGGRARGLPPRLTQAVQRLSGMDLSDVRVHYNSKQPTKVGADAFTRGSDIHVGKGHEKHLAHEAWHVVQQRQGRVRANSSVRGGAGLNTDRRLEREADRMAGRVGPFGRSHGPAMASSGKADGVLQRYTTAQTDMWPGSGTGPQAIDGVYPWRISDDGKLAVFQPSHFGGHECYALSSLISGSAATLKSQGSGLKLSGDSSDTIQTTVNSTSQTLQRVVPENLAQSWGGSGSGMYWPSDCGKSAHTVMTGSEKGKTKAVYDKARIQKTTWKRTITGFRSRLVKETDPQTYGETFSYYSPVHRRTVRLGTPQRMLTAIFRDISNDSFDNAWEGYMNLSDTLRDEFDQVVGLNKYAAPEVGEGFVIVSNQDEYASGTSVAWNYHWGAVVFKSGVDRVTFENFADPTQATSTDWSFQMYGRDGQSFHEEQKQRTQRHRGRNVPEYGTVPTTLRVRPVIETD